MGIRDAHEKNRNIHGFERPLCKSRAKSSAGQEDVRVLPRVRTPLRRCVGLEVRRTPVVNRGEGLHLDETRSSAELRATL